MRHHATYTYHVSPGPPLPGHRLAGQVDDHGGRGRRASRPPRRPGGPDAHGDRGTDGPARPPRSCPRASNRARRGPQPGPPLTSGHPHLVLRSVLLRRDRRGPRRRPPTRTMGPWVGVGGREYEYHQYHHLDQKEESHDRDGVRVRVRVRVVPAGQSGHRVVDVRGGTTPGGEVGRHRAGRRSTGSSTTVSTTYGSVTGTGRGECRRRTTRR